MAATANNGSSRNGRQAGPPRDESLIVQVKDLKKHFPVQRGLLRRTVGSVRAVDGVDLVIKRGETHGLVGESGSGKTTTGRMLLRALPPTDGEIWFQDKDLGWVDVADIDERRLRQVRRNMKIVYQDPYSSLNPRMTILNIVGEPLLVNGVRNRQERIDRVEELLKLVGLRPEFMRRYPHAFSGGQRQRIGIARALALNPSLVVADEPVSALDVSVQAQILNLLLDLQERLGLTYLFVAHDLSVVKHLSDRVAVMYVGKIVELAERDQLFSAPKHPYTAALLSAVPKPDPRARSRRQPLRGEVANPAAPPSGCYFHPRCPYAIDICTTDSPAFEEIVPGQWAACHRARELQLPGISLKPV